MFFVLVYWVFFLTFLFVYFVVVSLLLLFLYVYIYINLAVRGETNSMILSESSYYRLSF